MRRIKISYVTLNACVQYLGKYSITKTPCRSENRETETHWQVQRFDGRCSQFTKLGKFQMRFAFS